MFQTLLDYYTQFNELSRSNPMVAGMVGLWGAGLVTYMLRSVPMNIFHFFRSQLITSITVTNAENMAWSNKNGLQFEALMKWFYKNGKLRLSRNFVLESSIEENDSVFIGAGAGYHFFVFKRRLFWIKKEPAGVNIQSAKQINTVVVFCLSRSLKLIEDFVQEFSYKFPENRKRIYNWGNEDWCNPVPLYSRPLNTVIINKALKQQIISDLETFYASRDWYEQRGFTYKFCQILHGPSGTGKTSLIRALATYFKKNIYNLKLSDMTDRSFALALSSVEPGSFVLIEDVDSSNAVMRRKHIEKGPKRKEEGDDVPALDKYGDDDGETKESFRFLTLSGVLNALDGIAVLDDVVIFMTTNRIHSLDEAIIRKGRVNRVTEIPFLEDEEVRDYVALLYPELEVSKTFRFSSIAGCDLEDLYKTHHDNFDHFIEAIPKEDDIPFLRKKHG